MILGPAQVLAADALAADFELTAVPGILHGWAWRNTSDTVRADLELWDGQTGVRIVPITLCAGESTRDWLSGTGIQIVTGLYVKILSGSVDCNCWFRPHEGGRAPLPIDLAKTIEDIIDNLWQG